MILLDGKNLSAKIKDELKGNINSYKETPILAVITIGKYNEKFVNNKKKACEYVGMSFLHVSFDENVKEEKVIKRIKELNKDKYINGIIVQLPLPFGFHEDKIIDAIDISKDVDGFKNGSIFIPPVALGIMELFDYYKINLESKNVLVIGRNKRVGIPIMMECLKRNASVSICHSKTNNLSEYTRKSDIIISCVGKKDLITKSMIKPGTIIIDVGITYENNKIYGDTKSNVYDKCSYITPVPGGVGPMTVIMLVKNTFDAYKKQNGIVDMFDLGW